MTAFLIDKLANGFFLWRAPDDAARSTGQALQHALHFTPFAQAIASPFGDVCHKDHQSQYGNTGDKQGRTAIPALRAQSAANAEVRNDDHTEQDGVKESA